MMVNLGMKVMQEKVMMVTLMPEIPCFYDQLLHAQGLKCSLQNPWGMDVLSTQYHLKCKKGNITCMKYQATSSGLAEPSNIIKKKF